MRNSESVPAAIGSIKLVVRSIGLTLFIAVCFGFETSAGAAVILGNLPASNEGAGPDIGFGTQDAVKFTVGSSSQVLGNVILRIKTNANGTNIPAIDIRNDAGTTPGTTVLFTIDGTTALPTGTTTVQDYTLTATSTITLNANTSYWLVIRAKQGTFEWWQSSPAIAPSGSLATYNPPYKETMNDGTSWGAQPPFYSQLSFQMNTGGAAAKNALLNISTRLQVGTGDNVLIAGFILSGSGNKTVIFRAIGPSLSGTVPGAMADPKLEFFSGTTSIGKNDNWKTTQIGGVITSDQVAAIQASGFAPTNDAESAMIATLSPAGYTAVLSGVNNSTGIAVVEGYDLSESTARIGNISTRGFVRTGNGAMIGGFIIGNQTINVVIRAIGPSLSSFNVPMSLADPTLELRDVNGVLLDSNDNWKVRSSDGSSQQAQIEATGVPPTNDLESALVRTVAPGNYMAIVRGVNSGVGNAVVEVYNLQ
jgi:hypothetical protein